MHLAILCRCSLILMPATEVWISLNGPPLAWPGFKSKVSVWLGPPFIQSRMQERRRSGCLAVSAARLSSQPEREKLTTPAEESRSQSRRESEPPSTASSVRVMNDSPYSKLLSPASERRV